MKPIVVSLLVCLLLVWVSGKSLKEESLSTSKETHKCEYNGQTYSEGDVLPTSRLCLSCTCTKDFVEPNDYHCTVIDCPQTNHLELGCIPIYNDTGCCPFSWDCESVKALVGKCEKRYLKHYDIKGCIPAYEDGSECPARFQCPAVDAESANDKACEFKGRLYEEAEDIDTGNPCEICSCRKGWRGAELEINCISVECPSQFGPPPNDSCYEVFESGKCCSVRTDCSLDDPQQKAAVAEPVCVHGGETYHIGQKIYPEEDPCLICTCTEEWRGLLNSSSCSVHDCVLERKRKQLREGCLPIYHEATCCPIEFFCGSAEEGFQNRTVPMANSADIESGNTCIFQGAHYKLGQVLDINHPTNCVTCSCTTPPDFTCVHKKCSGPPNDDYVNCPPTYVPGDCCPTYNCNPIFAAPTPPPLCSPVKCPDGCSEVTVHNSCPFCQCQQRLCAPPKCPPECQLKQDTPSGCQTCQCPDTASVDRLPCSPVKCPAHCYEGTNPKGCPMCICGPLCSPPKCEVGCRLQRDVGPGECPRCDCPSDLQLPGKGALQCSPVKCLPTCRESVGESGCPSCICEPLCSPPKCDPGCHLSPGGPGTCPGCVCGDQKPVLLCAPVKCGPLCHQVFEGGDGCPSCVCDPLCSPPKCDSGCRLEHNPATGPCPFCVCDSPKEVCPRIVCGAMCQQRIGSDGCATCSCDPQCSPPKCDSGCHLEYDRSAGPCPACVCPDFRGGDFQIQCSMPKCDEGCVIDYSTSPCPSCKCGVAVTGIMCSPPNCDTGCHVDYSTKPCPSCSCGRANSGAVTGILCSPPKCDPGCQVDYSTKPCPSCSCEATNPGAGILCSPPKCDPGCHIDYSSKPCPSCSCGGTNPAALSGIMCSPPKCDTGCHVDYSTKPCPSCSCEATNRGAVTGILCSPPKCDPGCHVDYSTKPCPSCSCGGTNPGAVTGILCSPPKCDPGCHVDYSSKPCPSCSCEATNPGSVTGILCSPPKCDPGCHINYSSKPCPSCSCGGVNPGAVTGILCSPPKCDPGCHVDYTSKPCPSCSCGGTSPVADVMCSPTKCDSGCQVDHNTKPCPSCVCRGGQSGVPDILCSPPKCDPGCQIDYNSRPCPSCTCGGVRTGRIPDILCSPPKCEAGCRVDYSTKPCPSCTCDKGIPEILCSPPKCETGCRIDYSTQPCPSCACDKGIPDILCSPLKCESGCQIDYSTKPCPSCTCGSESPQPQCSTVRCDANCQQVIGLNGCSTCECPQCITPVCGPGCRVDHNAEPCPSCVCDRFQRRFATLHQLNVYSDPICGRRSCGAGCERAPVTAAQRCPGCICRGRMGERLNCAAMQCELPCRFEKFSPYGCPSCICHPIPCPVLDCKEGFSAQKPPEERCPQCLPNQS